MKQLVTTLYQMNYQPEPLQLHIKPTQLHQEHVELFPPQQ